ncbi:alpha/beta fold hydrolase [Lentibacillus halophilus]|uniref:Alpha/beta fold hydrolase n=1 Tax=Lentibacillus halophilus TaxID=295065 RepID=A0ABP3IXP2_9BACI
MVGCLIIHGYTGGPYEVEPLAAYLRNYTNWDVHVPTLPGHGGNRELDGVSYTAWLASAENALKKMREKTDRLYLIGFSMGGMIAAYLASRHAVDKLVLLATSRKYLSFRQMSKELKDILADGVKGNLGQNGFFKHYRDKWRRVPMKANLEFIRLVRFTQRYLPHVESPVLIVHGQRDMVVPYKAALDLDKEITSEKKEVVLFDRSRHLICLGDDKDMLNGMVYQFLTSKKAAHIEEAPG